MIVAIMMVKTKVLIMMTIIKIVGDHYDGAEVKHNRHDDDEY